jgi:hypothetical protein
MNHLTFRILLCLSLSASSALARTKDKPAPPKDSFDVVGHVPLTGASVSHLISTRHYSSSYLYAEQSSGDIAVIDVTDSTHPRVISSVSGPGKLVTATGDVALVSSETQPPSTTSAAKTISIVDFSDKANPKVTRQFAGVTSMGSDDGRGLVFLVNADGLWILHRNQAIDPAVQERYAHDVVYNH